MTDVRKTAAADVAAAEVTTVRSFEPVCDKNSRLLILGTMPSPASLAAGMYYSHPRNAFWRIMRDLTGDDPGPSNENKRAFLLRHGVALWDTLRICERKGALDGNIKSEQPNAVGELIARCPGISVVFLNGGAALKYYKRYHAAHICLPYFPLASTSPANARGGYVKKLDAWRVASEYLFYI
jgi:double-stranded uracil-DNA glycosylase